MDIIDSIKSASDSPEALTHLLNDKSVELFRYFNATHGYVAKDREFWYELVQKHKNVLRDLDYDNQFVRALIINLLDLACRFSSRASVITLADIVNDKKLLIGKRLEAETKLFYPSVSHPSDLIDRFENICSLLQTASEEEEADDRNVKAALLTYFDYILQNTQPVYHKQFIERVNNNLNSFPVLGLIVDEVNEAKPDHNHLRALIDRSLQRDDAPIVATVFGPNLIETATDYANRLAGIPDNFNSIRELAKAMTPGGRTLRQRGVEIITDPDDLLVYMHNYGNMHFAKVSSALELPFPAIDNDIDIIDWGCGQAIATMAFIEKFGPDRIKMIVLIEPSELALKRAALHCKKLAPQANIITICKSFDQIDASALPQRTSEVAVNLFSNVLDMGFFSHAHLFGLIESAPATLNFFVCASPAIDENAVARLEAFRTHFESSHRDTFIPYHNIVNDSHGKYWMCNSRYSYGVEKHGAGYYCGPHDANGCHQKWTRILKVFSVTR